MSFKWEDMIRCMLLKTTLFTLWVWIQINQLEIQGGIDGGSDQRMTVLEKEVVRFRDI